MEGNVQKMREALEIISRTELPPNSHTTEAGEVFTFADGNRWLGKMRTVVALAKDALHAQPTEHGRVKRVSLTMYSHKSQTQAHGDIAMTLDDALKRLAEWWGNNGTRLNDFEGIVFEVMDDTAKEGENDGK